MLDFAALLSVLHLGEGGPEVLTDHTAAVAEHFPGQQRQAVGNGRAAAVATGVETARSYGNPRAGR